MIQEETLSHFFLLSPGQKDGPPQVPLMAQRGRCERPPEVTADRCREVEKRQGSDWLPERGPGHVTI